MRLLLGLTALLCSLTPARSHPCKTPPYLSGRLAEGAGKVWDYEYNTALQRMRFSETEKAANQTFMHEYFLHFSEGVVYEVDGGTSLCTKRPLRTEYQPIGVPHNAVYSMNVALGSPSVPKAGVMLQEWRGYTSGAEPYSKTVTEEACVPVYTIYETEKYGQATLVFLNNTVHAGPQDDLNAPRFCPHGTDPAARPMNLMDLFAKSQGRLLVRALSKLKQVYLENYTAL